MQRQSPRTGRVLLTVGGVVLVAGLAWVVIDRILTRQAPDQWGGPNIGAGLLLLLAYAFIIIGLGVGFAGLVMRSRER